MIRHEYGWGSLHEDDVDADPIVQFDRWLDEAERGGVPEPTAMTLATADADGRPSARTVLLRGHGPDGFRFFTNRTSRKARELAANARAALVFRWAPFERQVIVTGDVEQLPDADSDEYWRNRPRGSQLGAWASDQSEVLPGRHVLEERLAELEARFPDGVPRPPHWGGYLVVPDAVELWQGRESRLHDRLRYRRNGEAWILERLSP